MTNEEANRLIEEYQQQKAVAFAAGMPIHPNLTEARKSAAVGLAKHFIDKGVGEWATIEIDGQKVRFTVLGFNIALTTAEWNPGERTLQQMFEHGEHLFVSWLEEAVQPHVNHAVFAINQFGHAHQLRYHS